MGVPLNQLLKNMTFHELNHPAIGVPPISGNPQIRSLPLW